jgi:arylsulfatase A-like enzyme/thioredoxin-like negative regulator of GroEL
MSARKPPRRKRARPVEPRASRVLARWVGAAATLALLGSAAFLLSRSGVRPRPGLNLLLVTIDTLRTDALGCYGNGRGTSPWIDRLADRGVRFEQAHAHNVITLPSHSNILSGRYPFEHGVRENAGFRFPAGTETLATRLGRAGYRTGAFVSGFPLDSRFGLDAGFEAYEDSFADGRTAVDFRLPERRGDETARLAARWIAETPAGRPWFAWVHLYDPHTPYLPPPELARRFPDAPYLGEVAAADAALSRLLGPLFEAGRDADTLVVLTADHGEGLGEHGEKTHGFFAYETTLRVPLLLWAPGVLPAGSVSTPARHVDIVPTVLEALALPVPDDVSGRSLLPAIAGETPPVEASYFEALSGMLTRGWAPLYGVVRDGHKYIELPLPELYDVVRDPDESDNRVALEPERLERLRGALRPLRERDGGIEQREEDAETRAQLAALGYISSGPTEMKETWTEADDPKNLIELDARMQEVIALQLAGDLPGALAAIEEVVARRPQMNAALVQMALVHKKLGDLERCARILQQALEQEPGDVGNAVLLATTFSDLGRARDAADVLGPFAEQDMPNLDALITRGVALAQLGRFDEALASFGAALERDPSNPLTRVQIATVHLSRGALEAAREQLGLALEMSPDLALAHHNAALLELRGGDDPAAVRHFRRAVELDAGNHEALLNLGTLLLRAGQTAEARACLERFAATAPRALYAPQLEQVRRLLARLERPPNG